MVIRRSGPARRCPSQGPFGLPVTMLASADEPYEFARLPQWRLKAAWQEVAEQCVEVCRRENPGTRPFLWWRYDAAEERDSDDGREESEQLYEMNELTDGELETLKSTTADEQYNRPFRRTWIYWAFRAPEQRNKKESELAQLQRMKLLNETELAIMSDPAMGRTHGGYLCTGYLTSDELELVGIGRPAGVKHTSEVPMY